jgi:hypothetical protein
LPRDILEDHTQHIDRQGRVGPLRFA